MAPLDPRRIALVGFGEVGGLFAQGLIGSGRHDVAAYDILMADPGAAIHGKARSVGAVACPSAASAAAGAAIVMSAVTAAAARDVAEAAAGFLRPGQIFLDLNSVSPRTKRAAAAAVERSGADYVEAAVMAPVAPYGLKVPILLGGRKAEAARALLAPAGMALEVASAEIGRASAIKLCRSIMIKGIEALTVECLLTARHYGVEDDVLASLDKTYPQMNWNEQAGYLLERVVRHGRRRAAEMREVADTVAETGLSPLMAGATADRQDWVADRVAEHPGIGAAPDADWRATLDALATAARLLARPPA
jgi:3-hydroxyisobutyrate dehydrogenase-like beta-hydroxyacid dehydrogenase